MVNISKALNARKIQAYHQADYANGAQKSYYSRDGELAGTWHGKLAEEMGLSGPISGDHFARLTEGQDPHSGAALVRHRRETEEATGHRAGWDATFSAPKSVSITALVGGDERIIEAHRQAAHKGLEYLERSVHARIGGNHPPERTGKWVAATFEHDTSRPVDGYSAPQLHTHAVFFNLTKTAGGKTHALQERPIFAAQKAATAIYQAELGYRLRQLGYELEEGKGGAREIQGYSQEYLKANSARAEQIEDVAERLEARGLNPAEARQRAAHSTRAAKGHLPAEQIRAQQQELARRFGNQHEAVISQARAAEQQARERMTEERAFEAAQVALAYSRDKNFEREAVVAQHDILRDALRRGQDLTTPGHVEAAIQAQRQTGALLAVQGKGNQPAYTTPEMAALEGQNIAMMRAGQNHYPPLLPDGTALPARIARHFEGFAREAERQSDPARRRQLTAAIRNQQEAVCQILSSRDQVQALQGAAGTGKTTSLTVIRQELEAQGYVVRGFAPTSRAAQQLAECGAPCSTLQMHLAKRSAREAGRAVYFLDESSLASAKQIHQFLARLQPSDRVVLIGDVRQHESVDAGRAFAQLQEHGMRTARLEEIVRQKDPALREAVAGLAAGRVSATVELLKRQGRVASVESETERLAAISREYLKDRAGALIVSPDNRSRAAINTIIHQQLQRAGAIDRRDHAVSVLVNRQDVTGADRAWAKSYEVGNVLRYSVGSRGLGLEKGEWVTVAAVDVARNEVTVERRNGETVTYNPQALQGASLYRREGRSFAVGERIQFTAPNQALRVANRELGAIESISGNVFRVKLDLGRTVSFDLRDHANLDYGYAVTSHSAQGLTTNRVLVNIDTERTNPQLINERLAYVAVSRARHDARIFTNDIAALGAALSRDVSKSSALTIDGRINALVEQQRAKLVAAVSIEHTKVAAPEAVIHHGLDPAGSGAGRASAPARQQEASLTEHRSAAGGNGAVPANAGTLKPSPPKLEVENGQGLEIEQANQQEHRMEHAEEPGIRQGHGRGIQQGNEQRYGYGIEPGEEEGFGF